MMCVDRILFPTDGSDAADHARRHAQYLADHFDATLHVIHVNKRHREPTKVLDVAAEGILADLHGIEPANLSFPVARLREQSVASPTAPEGILNYVVQYDIDLVVMGTHGRRGVRRLLLGSVAEEVVRKAPCPVVTVGRGAVPPERMEGGTLLVPVDFSDQRFQLLEYARELAPLYDMELTVLHVVQIQGLPDAYGRSARDPDPGVMADRAQQVLDEEVASLRESEREVSVEVRTGPAAATILDTAAETEPALILIATQGRTGLDRMLMGSVAETVIRQAPCPVFAVKSLGRSLVSNDED
jgi:nucleotide-binding universal stress UspA family protein